MNDADSHRLYRELSREINALSSDLVRGLGAIRFVAESNKDDVAELKEEIRRRCERLDEVVRRLENEASLLNLRVTTLEETRKDHTGKIAILERAETTAKIQVESTKGQWSFWVAVIGGGAGIAAALINALLAATR